ncbi:glucose uptake inhibitor SgrT [Edaphovirga cremea]|jgi:hypothetical protein|uniref:glucose uptake inhibitor SgrT n=1 Tax=Edaphovirga cremea TaxID=2267246 RepID=UPI003989B769
MKKFMPSQFYQRYFAAMRPKDEWLHWVPAQYRMAILEQLMQWKTNSAAAEPRQKSA